MSTELSRNKSRSSSSGTEGLPAKVAVDKGPASADNEATVLRTPVLPVPAPKFETAAETTARSCCSCRTSWAMIGLPRLPGMTTSPKRRECNKKKQEKVAAENEKT